ncbi:MAG: hypothetical protein KatS3mg131_2815 [Candidatus Tectimicrobiota bacterium]|nr:MAG: hypothetical protein KatS3mg131_2815 [Candidatus Tectomicrobia bacterium]
MLKEIAQATAHLMAVPVVSVWLADEAEQTLTLGAFSDEHFGADFPVQQLPVSEGGIGWVARHRRRLEVADVFGDPRFVALTWWRARGLRSFLGLPILFAGRLLGVLSLNGDRPFRFGEEDYWLLDTLVAQASIAIEHAQLFAAIGKQTQQLLTANAQLRAEIAERQRTEAALRESEQRFRKIFEEGPLGMAIVDRAYRYTHVNATLCRLLGYGEAELVGRSFLDITHPEEVERDRQQAARLLGGELAVLRTEKRYLRKSGEPLWVSLTASVIRDEADQPCYVLTMVEDISERKRWEAEQQRIQAELERRVKERTAALAQVNAELGPLQCRAGAVCLRRLP